MRVSLVLLAVCQTIWVQSMELSKLFSKRKKQLIIDFSSSLWIEGTASCQSPLLLHAKTTTSSSAERLGPGFNTWCPATSDVEPYFQATLSNITYITAIEIKSFSSDLDYRLEYTRENRIDPNTVWRSYRSLNHQQERIQLDPPMIARHVRLNLNQTNSKNLCLQFELFGCIFTDGVVSYSMLQGAKQLEDDTYDGQYDEKQNYLSGKATSLFSCADARVSSNVNFLFKMGSVNYPMDKLDRIIERMLVDFNGWVTQMSVCVSWNQLFSSRSAGVNHDRFGRTIRSPSCSTSIRCEISLV